MEPSPCGSAWSATRSAARSRAARSPWLDPDASRRPAQAEVPTILPAFPETMSEVPVAHQRHRRGDHQPVGGLSGLRSHLEFQRHAVQEDRHHFARIAEELDVDYVLEGCRALGARRGTCSRVRITPALVRTATTPRSAESYDRVLQDVFDCSRRSPRRSSLSSG